MIGRLTGLLTDVESDRCLVDVNGVGYVVSASSYTLDTLPRPPEVACILIETVIREDAFQLFGFINAEEREWFKLLTTVQGVGARVALAILSVSRPSVLWQAIQAGDKAPFTQAAGVGPRLATRLLTELKAKVAKMPPPSGISVPSGVTNNPLSAGSVSWEEDALMALEGLGFRRSESWHVVNHIMGVHPHASLDVIIRLALQELAR